MLKKISLYRLNNNELNTLVTRVLTALKPFDSLNTGIIAKIMLLVIGLNGQLTKSLNTSLKSQFSELLKNLDRLRDNAFKALRNAILACCQRLNETYNQHAEKLMKIIKEHGWSLWNENYQEESAKLNSLMMKFGRPEEQASLAIIELTDWYLELKKAQDDFEDTFQNKVSSDERDNYIAINTIRPKLIKKTAELLVRVNSEMEYSEDPDAFTELARTINNILDETNALAKSRQTRSGHDDEEDLEG